MKYITAVFISPSFQTEKLKQESWKPILNLNMKDRIEYRYPKDIE